MRGPQGTRDLEGFRGWGTEEVTVGPSAAVDPVSKGFEARPEVWTWTGSISAAPLGPLPHSPHQASCTL